MTTIPIGTNGYIEYNTVDNLCYNGSNGSIDITNIFFDSLFSLYTTYTITWSSDTYEIESNQISNNGRSLILLKSDNYHFTINSLNTNSSLGPYTVSITNPNEFIISKIDHSLYSCNSNGYIFVEVSGGTKPYTFVIANNIISQNNEQIILESLDNSTYDLSVVDQNGCLARNSTDTSTNIIIKDGNFEIAETSVLSPSVIDGFGQLNINIDGYGPFSFVFTGSTGENNHYIDFLNTKYLVNYDHESASYSYSFSDLLVPDTYTITIKNSLECTTITEIGIPNINPILSNITTLPDLSDPIGITKPALPILDTIFIPYTHIKNNTSIWQYIQKCIIENKIYFKFNDTILKQGIVRTYLSPYCNDNHIEVLRLGNNYKDWFFCLHIAPGINLLNYPNVIGNDIFLIDHSSETDHRCVVGLTDNNEISHETPSLLIGSFILQGSDNVEFLDNSSAIFTLNPDIIGNNNPYNILIKDIKTELKFNYYSAGYTTSIYFLENFNSLIENIDLLSSACSSSNQDWQYILSINKLLLELNNFNNIGNLFVYSSRPNYTGSISIILSGNPAINIDGVLVPYSYSIDFLTLDEHSDSLKSFYVNNNKITNTQNINGLPPGYIIVKIKDINNNKVKYIEYNNNIINYETHYTSIINFLHKFNYKVKNLFEYGDILVYISNSSSANDQEIETETQIIQPPPNTSVNVIEQQNTGPTTLNQSGDSSNTSTLKINISPANTVCYLLGPKNYKQKFTGTTIFNKVIPGVYTIAGDEEYLYSNTLHQNYTKVIISANQEYSVNVNFISYINKIFIKD